jgi:hypothetical protein
LSCCTRLYRKKRQKALQGASETFYETYEKKLTALVTAPHITTRVSSNRKRAG